MLESTVERLLFACRWLLAPIYLGLSLGLVALGVKFFQEALHPYSRKLMDSVPRLRGDKEPDFIIGQPPSLLNPPTGCRFKDRCPRRMPVCDEEPKMYKVDTRLSKCWLYE